MGTTDSICRRTTPAAPYQGGKRNLAKRLCAHIDADQHRTYVEPFVGMGGIFLRRGRRAAVEVINDISGDVANLYRVLQEHYPYFIDHLKWRVTSRAEFDRLRLLPADRLTDLNRAARFLYLQRLSFGGKVDGRTFGVDRRTPGRFDVTKLEPILADLHERLAGVVVEQLPYADLIRRYDGPDVLFYLDPPYVGGEDDYGPGYSTGPTSNAWPTNWRRSPAASFCRSTTTRSPGLLSSSSRSRKSRRTGQSVPSGAPASG